MNDDYVKIPTVLVEFIERLRVLRRNRTSSTFVEAVVMIAGLKYQFPSDSIHHEVLEELATNACVELDGTSLQVFADELLSGNGTSLFCNEIEKKDLLRLARDMHEITSIIPIAMVVTMIQMNQQALNTKAAKERREQAEREARFIASINEPSRLR